MERKSIQNMTEKEKSLSGMIYDASCDNGMHEEIYRTRCMIHPLNSIPPEQKEERDRLLHTLLDMEPDGMVIAPFFCDYGFNIHIGKKFFANTHLCILNEAPVTIGDNVFIAPNVSHIIIMARRVTFHQEVGKDLMNEVLYSLSSMLWSIK